MIALERQRRYHPVSMLLAAAGDSGLDLKAAAKRMNLSRRTLMRRLREAGMSFGCRMQDHRKSRASELLANAQFTVPVPGQAFGGGPSLGTA